MWVIVAVLALGFLVGQLGGLSSASKGADVDPCRDVAASVRFN